MPVTISGRAGLDSDEVNICICTLITDLIFYPLDCCECCQKDQRTTVFGKKPSVFPVGVFIILIYSRMCFQFLLNEKKYGELENVLACLVYNCHEITLSLFRKSLCIYVCISAVFSRVYLYLSVPKSTVCTFLCHFTLSRYPMMTYTVL